MSEDVLVSQPPVDIVVLGKIVDAYGLRGAVKVHPFVDDPVELAKMRHWWLGDEAGPQGGWRRVGLETCREQSGLLVASFSGIQDRSAAEAVCGLFVGAPRSALPATGVGEYYWADLIGLEVVNSQDQHLGKVLGLIETSANDVVRVGGEGCRELLLPFVAAVVLDVDLSARRMRVDWEADW